MAETITDVDVDVGITTVFAGPLVWYDTTNGETGGICNVPQRAYVGERNNLHHLAPVSNTANNCILPPAALAPDFSLTASPSSLTVKAAALAAHHRYSRNGFTGSLMRFFSGLPAGVTGSFSPGTVNTVEAQMTTQAFTSASVPGRQ